MQFGGLGEQINLIPRKKSINQSGGSWAQMEQEWANALNTNGNIKNVKIEVVYGSNGRPIGFEVEAYINKVKKEYTHIN